MFALLKRSRHLFPFVVKTEPGEWACSALGFSLLFFIIFFPFAIVHATSISKDDKTLFAVVEFGFTSTLPCYQMQTKPWPATQREEILREGGRAVGEQL
jgi:hypothetical protein